MVGTGGEETFLGDSLVVTFLSLANGYTGTGGAIVGGVLFVVATTGELARAGFPPEDPMLETLACLIGGAVVAGGGNGPRPSNEAGFVAAATAEAYLSSVGGRAVCEAGFGTPFGPDGNGGAVAVVEVTTGLLVATLARRFVVEGSFALTGGSSFRGVGGCSSVTD